MFQEDFTKGILPAGGRRLEPGSHMESERAPVKSAVPGVVGVAAIGQPLRPAAAQDLTFIDNVQETSGKLR